MNGRESAQGTRTGADRARGKRTRVLALPFLLWTSWTAYAYARKRGVPGLMFHRFGRRLGMSLLLRGERGAIAYIVNPVSSVRYFEFEFVSEVVSGHSLRCLDVSSPRLFSLWLSKNRPSASIRMINPDRADIATTERMSRRLGIDGIETRCVGVESLAPLAAEFDFIYSISVIEHVSGELDDRDAIRLMWKALVPGGILAITFPVDREYREEYRETDYYGTQSTANRGEGNPGRYFFQRHYDAASIRERLLEPVGTPAHSMRYFGERTPGYFAAYEKRWMTEGLRATAADPREIADHFREFGSLGEMPGWGVCGMCLRKPGEHGT